MARAAVDAGIGWVVLNREANYVADLRKSAKAPAFAVTVDHVDIGRIQSQQCAALLPDWRHGTLHARPLRKFRHQRSAEGNAGAEARESALDQSERPMDRGELHACRAFLAETYHLQESGVDLVAAQDDSMAIGARKAFQEFPAKSNASAGFRFPSSGSTACRKPGRPGCAADYCAPRSSARRTPARRLICSWMLCEMENHNQSAR